VEARERDSIRAAIDAAIRQIALHDPELAEILKSEIVTGHFVIHLPNEK
jgi:hypothetical protein